MSTLAYYTEEFDVVIEQPSPQEIREAIMMLDNETVSLVHIFGNHQYLSIKGGDKGMVALDHTKRDRDTYQVRSIAALIGLTPNDSPAELSIIIGGQATYRPLWLAVPKEIAVQVAVYFVTHGHVPDDLSWHEF